MFCLRVITSTVGSYPRPKWFREYLKKIEGLQKDVYGRVERDVLRKAIKEVIEEQEKAKIDLMTDGQLIWHDFLAHFATKLEGFEMGKLARYFDNNLYYRVPIAKGKIRRKEKMLDDFELALEVSKRLKPVSSFKSTMFLSFFANFINSSTKISLSLLIKFWS